MTIPALLFTPSRPKPYLLLRGDVNNETLTGHEIYRPWAAPVTFTSGATGGSGGSPRTTLSPRLRSAAVYQNTTPFVCGFPLNGLTWGAKFTAISPALAASPNTIAFSPSGRTIICMVGTTIHAHPWSETTGFGTRLTNPGVTPPGSAVAFSPDGRAVAFAGGGTVHVWAWSDDTGFGTQYAAPSVAPSTTSINGVAFSHDGIFVVGSNMNGYQWNSETGFGTRYVATTSAVTAGSVSVHPNGKWVALYVSDLNFLKYYPWNPATGFGTVTASNIGPSSSTGIDFNYDGTYLAVSQSNGSVNIINTATLPTGLSVAGTAGSSATGYPSFS